jgi:hypothetical protein
MKRFKRKIVWLSVIAAAAMLAGGWLVLYVLSGVSDAIALNGPRLLDLRTEWLLDGSPEPPPLTGYVAKWTDPSRFYVWTNGYRIDGRAFQSLFGMDDPRFEGKGILVVSREGELIWVESGKPPQLRSANRQASSPTSGTKNQQ